MNEAMQEQRSKRVIGLDAHPYLFSAAALAGPDARQAQVEWLVDRLPLERLEQIVQQRVSPDDIVVLEASGNSFELVARINRCGRRAVVLESQSVGKVSSTYCSTDKADAIKLARVYLSGLARVVWTPDAKARGRRELFFAHRRAVRDAVCDRNRIWAWLNDHGLKRPKNLRLAQRSARTALLSLRAWTPMQQVLIEDLLETFWNAEKRRARLRALIAEEVAGDPQLLKMMRLLGIRNLIAFALAAFIGPVERFASPRKLVAFFGLNPRVATSGIGGGNGPLAHYGRADVRALLIQAAHSILRYGRSATQRWAVALKMRKGTALAIAALARKLVVALWYLLMGCFTPLTEVNSTLKVKIHKLATDIGAKRLRQLGFKDTAQFEEEKTKLLLLTT
jgi:transposase